MNFGFFVNNVFWEKSKYTTIKLAHMATQRGHRVMFLGAGDFSVTQSDVNAYARSTVSNKNSSAEEYFKNLMSANAKVERINLSDLDLLFLRNNPTDDIDYRSWAQHIGMQFSRLSIEKGLLVLNDPTGLEKACTKLYMQYYPEHIRPKSIVTRNHDEIRKFAKQQGGKIIIKPMQGSQGRGVFLVDSRELSNLNQMIDADARDGYVIAEEFIPEGAEGDTRIFLLNGDPIKVNGKYAAFKRVHHKEDIRNNLSAGGTYQRVKVCQNHLDVLEVLKPKLIEDGLFFVGVDMVGQSKVMEINVFSPGGIGVAEKLEKEDFSSVIIDSMEKKVTYLKKAKENISNIELAVF